MRTLKVISFILVLSLAACVQTVGTYGVRDAGPLQAGSYTLYEYGFGSAGPKAVFLKSPDAGIEVVPYSVQISVSSGTAADAMGFMDRAAGSKSMSVRGVAYKGKTIGYLIVTDRSIVSKGYVEPYFFERDGRIYFSVSERMND